MSWRHRDILEAELHEPKGFTTANNGDSIWRNEQGLSEWTDREVLPAALNFVDASVAPPTTGNGDIYVLSLGASIHANWGTVALKDWVRYDGVAWNVITPSKSILCYDKTEDVLMSYDGSVWATVGSDTNLATTDLTQTDNVRTYTLPSGTNKFLDILGATDNALRMLNNADIIFNSSTNGTGVNNMRLVSVLNQARIELNNNFWKIHAIGTSNLFLGSTSGTKGSVTIETGVVARTPGTAGATSLSGPEIRFYDRNLSNQWAKFDINGKFIFGSNSFVGAEKFSIQNDTLVKGSDTSESSKGFCVTDVNNDVTFDVRNNGQIGYGGAYLNTVGHKFRNPNNEGIIAAFDNDGSGGVESFKINTNGSFESEQGGQRIFWSYRQSGQSYIRLFDAGVETVRLNKANSFVNSAFLVGGTTIDSKARFEIQQASTNISQQLFFANARMTTAGRTGSSGSFGTAQAGFECYDTDINKKYFWNGSAWEKIKGNIESVSQATATTLTPNIDVSAMEILSSLAAALTIAAPTGTPHEGQELTFRFKDDGTARALTWNAIFEDYTGSLPTTTTAGKTVYIGCKYNLINTKWDVVAVQNQP